MNEQFKYKHLPTISNLPLRQKMAVLTGAGISAESGLATFRDNNGLWNQVQPLLSTLT